MKALKSLLACLMTISIGIGLFSSCEKNSKEKLIDQVQGQWIVESGTEENGDPIPLPDINCLGAEYQGNQITLYVIEDGLSILIDGQGFTSAPDADQIIYDIPESKDKQLTTEMTEGDKLQLRITKDGKVIRNFILIRGSFKTNTLLEKIQGQWVAVEILQVGEDPVSFPLPNGLSLNIEIKRKEARMFETQNGHITDQDDIQYTEDIDQEELIFRYGKGAEEIDTRISLKDDLLYLKAYLNDKYFLTYIFKRGTFSE